MLLRSLLCAALAALVLAGCAHPEKDAEAAKKKKKKPEPAMKDVSNDTSFQAFVGHLRTAVAKRDRTEIASLMAPDFGYRFDNPPPGETPFDYWEQNSLWAELDRLLHQRFSPKGDFMVSPPKFVEDDAYRGPRAGLRLFNGSWRFAYFVTGEDVLQ